MGIKPTEEPLAGLCYFYHSKFYLKSILNTYFLIFDIESKSNGEMMENPKGDSQFAAHLKASEAVSVFARSKTLREQREFLPAFAIREELLRIIRDNQGIYELCTFC